METLAELQDRIPVDLSEMAIGLSPIVLRLFLVWAGAHLGARILRRFAQRIEDPRARNQLLFFLPKMVRIVAVVAGLHAIGIDVLGAVGVLATIGVTGAIIFTPIGQNMVAGTMTSFDDIYRIGEVVTVGEWFGRIMSKSFIRTELLLPDGTTAWVPNSKFQDEEIFNHTRLGGYRIEVEVPLDGNPDRALAVATMQEVLANLPWNCPGREPALLFDHVGGDAMFYKAFAWIEDRMDEPRYKSELLTTLVDALQQAGVSVGQTTNISTSSFLVHRAGMEVAGSAA